MKTEEEKNLDKRHSISQLRDPSTSPIKEKEDDSVKFRNKEKISNWENINDMTRAFNTSSIPNSGLIDNKNKTAKIANSKRYRSLKLSGDPNSIFKHLTFGGNISEKKKLKNELASLPEDKRKIFSSALKNYKFGMEVYVPQTMLISKKEYIGKNYLLNQLVECENMINSRKKFIEPIARETKQFSMQYKLVRSENKEKQKKYLSNIEKAYEEKGYSIKNIEYKNNENIFTPSFILDNQFGNDRQSDIIKYGYSQRSTDYKTDQDILNKLEKSIFKKRNRNTDQEEGNKNENKDNGFDTVRNERELEIQKELKEEKRIRNMDKKQYSEYNKKLHNEIQIIKDRINDLKNGNDFIDNIDIQTNTDYNNFRKNRYQQLSNLTNKKITNITSNRNRKKLDEKNIFVSSKGLDLETDLNSRLPSINLLMGETGESKNSKRNLKTQKTLNLSRTKNNHSNKSIKYKDKKERNKDKINEIENLPQKKQLNQIYSILNYSKDVEYSALHEAIENYFNKYKNRKLPKISKEKGSNIHNLVEEFQGIVKENTFANFAKLNDMTKKNINRNKNKNKSVEKVTIYNEDRIEKIDDKINNLHFELAENLLGNIGDEVN